MGIVRRRIVAVPFDAAVANRHKLKSTRRRQLKTRREERVSRSLMIFRVNQKVGSYTFWKNQSGKVKQYHSTTRAIQNEVSHRPDQLKRGIPEKYDSHKKVLF